MSTEDNAFPLGQNLTKWSLVREPVNNREGNVSNLIHPRQKFQRESVENTLNQWFSSVVPRPTVSGTF